MYESKQKKVVSLTVFIFRFLLNLIFGLFLIAISLGMGMLGYYYFENMTWVDAYVNASMILSGMGPVGPLTSNSGKIFAGTYALFSGIVFLFLIALIFAPILHRIFHKFHLEEDKH